MAGGNIYVGGASGKLFAAIGATYPVGATITCENGTKTLEAKDTSGQCIFSIPNVGTWIVTATNGVDIVTKSVSITAPGELAKIKMIYPYLYKSGNEYENETGGWVGLGKKATTDSSVTAASPTITRNTGNITATHTAANGGILYCKEPIDLTDVSAITVKGSFTRGGTSTNNLQLCAWSSIGATYNANRAAYLSISTSSNTTLTLDVSELTGLFYIGFGMAAKSTTVTFTEVKLV